MQTKGRETGARQGNVHDEKDTLIGNCSSIVLMIRNNEQNINIVCARGRQGWWDENGKSNLIRNYQDYCQGKYAD